MAYKKREFVKSSVEADFTIGRTLPIRQRNGVLAIKIEAVKDDGTVRQPVTIFANGKRVDIVRPAFRPGAKVRLLGKFSQHNTFVALGLVAQG